MLPQLVVNVGVARAGGGGGAEEGDGGFVASSELSERGSGWTRECTLRGVGEFISIMLAWLSPRLGRFKNKPKARRWALMA